MQLYIVIMIIASIGAFIGYKIECWNDKRKSTRSVDTEVFVILPRKLT